MVDAQTVAEDSPQTVHHLHGQGYLGQQVEYLSVLLNLALYKMNVYLGLTAGGDAMEQGDRIL